MVRMPERFWDGASFGQTIHGFCRFAGGSVIDAVQTDNEWLFGQELDRLIQQSSCFPQISSHQGQLNSKIDWILVLWILGAPSFDFVQRRIVILVPNVYLHDAMANSFSGVK